eukprot:gene31730-6930_t
MQSLKSMPGACSGKTPEPFLEDRNDAPDYLAWSAKFLEDRNDAPDYLAWSAKFLEDRNDAPDYLAWSAKFLEDRNDAPDYLAWSAKFLEDRNDAPDYLAWSAWVCVWTTIMLVILAVLNTGKYIMYASGLSGETFGFLIAILFLQQAVNLTANSYIGKDSLPGEEPRQTNTPNTWEVKDSWSVTTRMRDVPADYVFMAIVPAIIITILFWFDHGVSSLLAQEGKFKLARATAYSYDLLLLAFMTEAPQPPTTSDAKEGGELRRQEMKKTLKPPGYTKLTFVDTLNGWRSKMGMGGKNSTASIPSHNKPTMHHIASAPVIPVPLDSPKAVAHQERNGAGPLTNGDVTVQIGEGSGEGSMAEGGVGPDSSELARVVVQEHSASNGHSNGNGIGGGGGRGGGGEGLDSAGKGLRKRGGTICETCMNVVPETPSSAVDDSIPGEGNRADSESPERLSPVDTCILDLRAHENRASNFIQSVLCAITLFLTPLIQFIPTSVLWGYFAYMALASLPGNGLWERVVLLFSDPVVWKKYLADNHGVTVTFTVWFTIGQFSFLIGIMALVTWAGITGVIFPVPIVALMGIRLYFLTRVLKPPQLQMLKTIDPVDPIDG